MRGVGGVVRGADVLLDVVLVGVVLGTHLGGMVLGASAVLGSCCEALLGILRCSAAPSGPFSASSAAPRRLRVTAVLRKPAVLSVRNPANLRFLPFLSPNNGKNRMFA